MDFVTSVTSTRTSHAGLSNKDDLGADRDPPGQGPAFEEEIAALRDPADKDAAGPGDIAPQAETARSDPENAETAPADPDEDALLDLSKLEVAAAELSVTESGDVPSELAVAAAATPGLGAASQVVSADRTGAQTSSDGLALAAETAGPTAQGRGGVDGSEIAVTRPRDASLQTIAQGPDAATITSRQSAAAVATAPDVLAGPTAGASAAPAGSPAALASSGLGNTGLMRDSAPAMYAAADAARGDGTAQSGALARSEIPVRASSPLADASPAAARGGASAAVHAGPNLPPVSAPMAAEAPAGRSANAPGQEIIAAQALGPRQDGATMSGPSSGRTAAHSWTVADTPTGRSGHGVQIANAGDAGSPTGGSSSASNNAGSAALPQPIPVAGPVTAPLFALPGSVARDGTVDAAFLGSDLAALETGRSAPGTFGSVAPVPAEPRAVARQIADAMIAAHENGVDLQLSPEELGRVKLSMTQGESGFLVTISADRPETLELLRRHIDLLGEEFAALGLGDAAFSFSDPQGEQAQGGLPGTPSDAGALDMADTSDSGSAVPTVPQQRAQSGLLDIRL